MSSTRFVHSADWQLGMTRRFLGEEAQAVYSADRLAAVGALNEVIRQHEAQFLVVAGDAFESNAVPRSVVLRAAEILADFTVPVLLLPGNHDPLDISSVYRCPDFLSATEGSSVQVVDSLAPREPVPGVEVVGVPWTSKRSDPARVPQLLAALQPTRKKRILLLHGGTDEIYSGHNASVDSLSVAALEGAINSGLVDYVALGDRHSVTKVGSGERIWYSGSPETTAFDDVETASGAALVVSLGPVNASGAQERGSCEVVPSQLGSWSFVAIDADIDTESDLEALVERIEALNSKSRTIIKIALTGTISVRLKARIDDLLDRWSDLFAAAYLRQSRSHLVVNAGDEDLTALVSGYSRKAVEELVKIAASESDKAGDASNALSLLYRLTGKAQR